MESWKSSGAAGETDRYYLEKVHIALDSDDEFQYEEVPVEEDLVERDIEESLDDAVRVLREEKEDAEFSKKKDEAVEKPSVIHLPEVVDDFVRNFLVRMGLMRTMDCFQTEWYELQQRKLLKEGEIGVVPDVYSHNQKLEDEINFLKAEVTKYKDAALKAKDTYVKLRKERDYHRMHHKRVVQEKNKLIDDLKRLKRHYAVYEPTLEQLKTKYEAALREKMMATIGRDRILGQVTGLQSTIKNLESLKSNPSGVDRKVTSGQPQDRKAAADHNNGALKEKMGPTQRNLARERERAMGPRPKYEDTKDVAHIPPDFKRHPNDSEFPPDDGINPNLVLRGKPSGHISRTGGFRLTNTFQAHASQVSGLALHPRKQILATTSDDHTWKMWAVPNGDIIMTGEGHTDWVSDCTFHPSGSRLATTSGDTTVKIWDFSKAACIHTFTDHTLAVWGCSWHSCGDFVATCSMDCTSKVWDLNSLRCRNTLRGHADSVNSIEFLPFANTLLTASADKTLSLWDARTGLCAQTYYGHLHAVNHATWNMKGDTIVSCDAYGVVKLWDVRTISPMTSVNLGPHSTNRVSFDPNSTVVAVACNDAMLKMYEIANGEVSTLVGHDEAVQCVLYDQSGEFIVTGGSDSTVRIWS